MADQEQPRLTWSFKPGKPMSGNPQEKQAHAAEFIAYYLDRIDRHLERIANHMTAGKTKADRS
jgi:hypothetical protein